MHEISQTIAKITSLIQLLDDNKVSLRSEDPTLPKNSYLIEIFRYDQRSEPKFFTAASLSAIRGIRSTQNQRPLWLTGRALDFGTRYQVFESPVGQLFFLIRFFSLFGIGRKSEDNGRPFYPCSQRIDRLSE